MLQALFASILFLIGGLRGSGPGFDLHMATSYVVWLVFVRYCFTQTLHSLLDTLNHGTPPFNFLPDTYGTRSHSKNNLTMWLFHLGNETWHNVHHAFPRAANNGAKWWRWDCDALVMKAFEKMGVISGCQWLTEEDLARRREHTERRKHRSHELATMAGPNEPISSEAAELEPVDEAAVAD